MFNSVQSARFLTLLNQSKMSGFRVIVHIQLPELEALDAANQLIRLSALNNSVWLNQKDGNISASHHLQKLLGTETDVLIVNAYQGFNPNALGIAAGCIRAGGVFILLTPVENEWPNYPDPDYQRMLTHTVQGNSVSGRFIRHVIDCLNACHAVVRIRADIIDIPLSASHSGQQWPDYNEQNHAIELIKRVALGHKKRPLVIQADRGRGKSAALGIAAGELLRENDVHIVVTAPSALAVQTLFRHAINTLEMPVSDTLTIVINEKRSLKFLPVDALINSDDLIDVVIIDEAAAIPTHLLKVLVEKYRRLVFSTTVNGYEGNGRGFSVRFHAVLNDKMPQWRLLELEKPLRWAAADPLEQWCNDVLLLSARSVDNNVSIKPQFVWIDRDELIKDKALLKAVFSLLVTAHYKTTADDLRIMLDHPDVSIAIAKNNAGLLAVVLLMREGELNDSDVQALNNGNRRFHGHLLPQLLNTQGFPALLTKRVRRIIRIAVQPECQSQGIGKALIGFVENTLTTDFIGACFSVDSDVLYFWQSLQMQVVHLGVHRDSSTGQFSCAVLKPLTNNTSNFFQQVRTAFFANIPYQLLTSNASIDTKCILPLLLFADLPSQYLADFFERDLAQAQAFIKKERSFEVIQPCLSRLFLFSFIQSGRLNSCNKNHLMMIEKLFLAASWQDVFKKYDFQGRRQTEDAFRTELHLLLSITPF